MRKELSTKNILRLTWPTVISHSTVIFVGIIDLLCIRNLGIDSVTIVSTANSFIVGLYAFMEGIKSGTTVITAKYFGAKNKTNVSKTLNVSLLSAIIIGTLIAMLSPLIAKTVFYLISDSQIQKFNNFSYLSIRLFAAPLVLIIYALIGFFNGLKKTLISSILTISILTINALFNYPLIWRKLGSAQLGLKGAAIATIIAYFTATIISLLFLFKNKFSAHYINFKLGIKKLAKEYLKTAIDIGIYSGLISLTLLIFIVIFSQLGSQALTVHQLTFQILMISCLIPGGFFTTSSILIGKILGEKKENLIIYATSKITLISILIVSLISILIFIFAKNIALIFSPTNIIVANLTAKSIRILCVERIFGTIYLVLKGALTGAQDTKFIVISSFITSYLFFLPLTYLMGIKMHYGVTGGYAAFLIWTILDALILCWRFFINKGWKRKH